MKKFLRFVAVSALVAGSTWSVAAPTVFSAFIVPQTAFTVATNEAPYLAKQAFLGAVQNVGTETMDGFATGQVFPCSGWNLDPIATCKDAGGDEDPNVPQVGFSFAGRGITAAVNGGSNVATLPEIRAESTQQSVGRFDTTSAANGATPLADQKLFQMTHDVTLVFNQAVNAFGFYATDVGDFNGGLTVVVHSTQGPSNGRSYLAQPAAGSGTGGDSAAGGGSPNNGGLLFWGIAMDFGDLITSVSLRNSNQGFDAFGLDDVMVADLRPAAPGGNGVPLPGTAWLALLAFGFAALTHRRAL